MRRPFRAPSALHPGRVFSLVLRPFFESKRRAGWATDLQSRAEGLQITMRMSDAGQLKHWSSGVGLPVPSCTAAHLCAALWGSCSRCVQNLIVLIGKGFNCGWASFGGGPICTRGVDTLYTSIVVFAQIHRHMMWHLFTGVGALPFTYFRSISAVPLPLHTCNMYCVVEEIQDA